MKYLLLLSLFLVGCTPNDYKQNEPKLFFNDKILIKKGFYKNCKARVVALNNLSGCYKAELEYKCDYKETCLEYDRDDAWEKINE